MCSARHHSYLLLDLCLFKNDIVEVKSLFCRSLLCIILKLPLSGRKMVRFLNHSPAGIVGGLKAPGMLSGASLGGH